MQTLHILPWGSETSVIFRAILGHVVSPRPVHPFSPKLVHLFSPKLVHDRSGETPPSRAYFLFSDQREREELCLERGKGPWIFEKC